MKSENTKLSDSDVKPKSTPMLSYSGLTRISRWKKFANWFDLDTPVKPECDTVETDAATCQGRSMVEMLGVLAIIGVLSVGAIAGYSKAMMKYKLNKQTEQISSILDYVNIHMDDFKRSKTSTAGNIIPLLKKLNVIPQEMIRKNISSKIFDIFGNSIGLQNYTFPNSGVYYFEIYIVLNKGEKESCMNLFTIAKAQRGQLWRTKFETRKGEAAGEANSAFGDNYCTSAFKCLKDLTIAEMEDFCNVCEDKDSCRFYYQMLL